MKRFLIFLFISLLSLSSTACLNEIGIIRGVTTVKINEWELAKPYVSKAELRDYILTAKKGCGGAEEICSDLVIAYLYNGEFAKALDLSTRLVARFPKKYEIVMTHAGALELNGKFAEALRFIRKGMKINPASHENSEWIHVKILEARIKGGDPKTILDLGFGNGNEPLVPAGMNLRLTLKQLHFQLMERYYFIPKSDQQFGALLHDYANLLYVNNFKTISRDFYRMAVDYGFSAEIAPSEKTLPALKKAPEAEQPVVPKRTKKPDGTLPTILVLCSVVVLFLGILFIRTRKRS